MLLHYGELSTTLPVIAEIPERSKLEETPLPQGNPLYTRGVATLTQPLTDPVTTLTQPLTDPVATPPLGRIWFLGRSQTAQPIAATTF